MKCKDCVHYELCQNLEMNGIGRIHPKQCDNFKDKTRFVELPCENWFEIVFGDKDVFYGIQEETVSEINVYNEERLSWYDGWRTVVIKGFDENENYWEFSPEDIGKTVFLTQKEAEEKLKENNNA